MGEYIQAVQNDKAGREGERERDRERGSRPSRMGVFRLCNDGKVSDPKRISRKHVLKRPTFRFIEVKQCQSTIGETWVSAAALICDFNKVQGAEGGVK